jgi:hypothetical protein
MGEDTGFFLLIAGRSPAITQSQYEKAARPVIPGKTQQVECLIQQGQLLFDSIESYSNVEPLAIFIARHVKSVHFFIPKPEKDLLSRIRWHDALVNTIDRRQLHTPSQ